MVKSSVQRVLWSFLLLVLAVSAHAAGQREDPVRQARLLVSQGRVNEAILLLEQTVRDNPDRIVEAEALLRAIREIRGEYNVLFEQLIDNLVNNPENIDRTLQIIDMMEALDEFPNQRVLSQVEDARIVAQLAFDRNVVENTMDAAFEQIAAGRFLEAVETYHSLRNLQRERFDSRGYGDIFVNRVNQNVGRLTALVEDIEAQSPGYMGAGSDVLELARTELDILEPEDLDFFLARAGEMVEVVLQANELMQDLTVTRSQVALQFPDFPVDWYLNFLETIIRGRPGRRNEEGIDYVVRRIYRDNLEELAEIMGERGEQEFAEGVRLTAAGQFSDAVAAHQRAAQAAEIWELAESSLVGIMEREPDVPVVVSAVSPEDGEPFIRARTLRVAAGSLAAKNDEISRRDGVAPNSQVDPEILGEEKERIQAMVARLRDREATWRETTVDLRNPYQTATGVPEAAAMDLLATVDQQWEGATRDTVDREIALTVARARSRVAAVDAALQGADQRLRQVAPLLDGVEEELDQPEIIPGEEPPEGLELEAGIRIVRYPDEAQERLEALFADLQVEQELLAFSLAELLDDLPYVTETPPVQNTAASLEELERRAAELQNGVALQTSRSEELIAEAATRRNQGFQQVAAARSAISALQLDAARNRWNDAREAFFDSLELREDQAFRQEADQLIQQVGLELLELENVIVVQRVRELLNAAESQYNQDEYIAARDTLLEAQQTWEQTNVEPNSEIERWLVLATAAISLEEGRDLSPADPLYPILGNYLSLAREDFNRATVLIRQGNDGEADRLFERSLRNLRNVRDVRPLNWDARILELEIVQIRNPDDFDDIFATRYRQALERLPEVGPLEVFGELEVLAEINPNFPGIQQQLRRLEISLNLRPDPVDQTRIVEARQLFQRAQQLSSGTRDQAVVAVSLLEEAVNLNPGDGNVRFLLDQLRIRLGGQATVALSSVDEQQYRRAETLFAQGQVLQALGIVERLLASGGNQAYPPLVELRRRIGLRLGI